MTEGWVDTPGFRGFAFQLTTAWYWRKLLGCGWAVPGYQI
jgi:hypothetical protein